MPQARKHVVLLPDFPCIDLIENLQASASVSQCTEVHEAGCWAGTGREGANQAASAARDACCRAGEPCTQWVTAAYSHRAQPSHDHKPKAHRQQWPGRAGCCWCQAVSGMAQQHRAAADACGRPDETADLHEDEGVEDHRVVLLLALYHVVLVQSLSPAGAQRAQH